MTFKHVHAVCRIPTNYRSILHLTTIDLRVDIIVNCYYIIIGLKNYHSL